jgi:limonene 1,2-monooxygenase
MKWFHYFQKVAAFPQMNLGDGSSVKEYIDFVNTSGIGVIGTVDQAGEQIERLWKQSNGGFGAYLQLNHDWANPRRKANSYELFARHVMPEFQGQAYSTRDAAARASAARPELAQSNLDAVAAATAKYAAEKDQR